MFIETSGITACRKRNTPNGTPVFLLSGPGEHHRYVLQEDRDVRDREHQRPGANGAPHQARRRHA